MDIDPVLCAIVMPLSLLGMIQPGCSADAPEPRPDFKPPSAAERLRAIGSTENLDAEERRAFEPGDDFDPIPPPGPADWLAAHPETGQTFDEFVGSRRRIPHGERKTIYLLPLGKFDPQRSPDVEILQRCAEAYFSLKVKMLPVLPLEGLELTTRERASGKRQLLTGDILALLKRRLPADAFCLLAITMEDLYPDPAWNFVFGQASLRGRVGIYSFARYDPAFYGEKRDEGYRQRLLRRSVKVLVHETAHMFGLLHCVYFRCVINGSNHLQESDSRPLRLCPVCLRKLQSSTGFRIVERYRSLASIYRRAGFQDEARWIERRIQTIAARESKEK